MGRRSGKSWMAAHEIIPWLLTPKTRGGILAPNYSLGQKIAREVKRIVLTELKLPVDTKKEVNGDLYFLRLAGLNSELSIKSADSPESLIGEGIDYLVVDEMAIIPQQTYEMYVRPTLADRQGWALFCSTPRGFNYFEYLFKLGQDPKYPDYESWQVPSWESPFFKDDIEELKRTLTKETFRQEIGADFTSFSGKVLPFSRSIHIKKNLKYNKDLPVYVGIDFGFRASHCVVLQTRLRDKGLADIYQIDEIALKDTKTEDFAKLVKALPYNVTSYFADPAGVGVSMHTGVSDFYVFQKLGMRIRHRRDKATRDVINGVGHVRRWFEDANGDAHFFVAPRCKASIESYENYRYPKHREEQALREMPLKDGRFDHACDALRFAICNLFSITSRQVGLINW